MKHDRFKVEKTGRHESGVREYIEHPDTGKPMPGSLVYGGFTDRRIADSACAVLNENPELSWADIAQTLLRAGRVTQQAEQLLFWAGNELQAALDAESDPGVLFKARHMAHNLGMTAKLQLIERRLEALGKEDAKP